MAMQINIGGVWGWFQVAQRAHRREPPEVWERNILTRRPTHGHYHHLFQELQDGNFFTFNYYNSGQLLLMYCSFIAHVLLMY